MGAIEEPQAGQSTFELWKTVAQLVKSVNIILNGEVKINEMVPEAETKPNGKYLVADGNAVLQLNLGGKLTGLPPFKDLDEEITYALVAKFEGRWIAKWAEICAGGDDTALKLD